MTRLEVLNLRYGEMVDLINCDAIEKGTAKPKPHKLAFDEVMALR